MRCLTISTHTGTGDAVRGDLYQKAGDTYIHIGITLEQ